MTDEVKQEVTTVSTSTPEEKEIIKTTKVVPPIVKTEHPQKVFEKKKTIFRVYQIMWYLLAVIETILGFRVALKALGANSQSDFTSLVYVMSDPFALPFSGILPQRINGASILEWSTLVAALVYALIVYGITRLIHFTKPVTPKEVEQEVDGN